MSETYTYRPSQEENLSGEYSQEEIRRGRDFYNYDKIKESVVSVLKNAGAPQDRQAHLFKQMAAAAELFPGREAEYRAFLADLGARQFTSEEEMIEQVSREVLSFVERTFSYGQLGRILAERGRDQDFKSINKVLSYGGNKNLIHIHFLPEEGTLQGMRPKEAVVFIKREMQEGLRRLARLVVEDPKWREVQTITATSPFVAKYPKFLEELGFTLEGEISPELRRLHFADEKRPVGGAVMSREKLLELYG